jgi:hypothetical protein
MITGRSNIKEKRKLLKKKGIVKETAEKGWGPERPYEKTVM